MMQQHKIEEVVCLVHTLLNCGSDEAGTFSYARHIASLGDISSRAHQEEIDMGLRQARAIIDYMRRSV